MPDEMRFYQRFKTTERNSYIIIVAYVPEGSSGAWSRVLAHKSVIPGAYISRPMVQEELDRTAASWRMHYLKYDTWQGLLTDEWLVTEDPEWILQLIAWSGKKFTIDQIIPADYNK